MKMTEVVEKCGPCHIFLILSVWRYLLNIIKFWGIANVLIYSRYIKFSPKNWAR